MQPWLKLLLITFVLFVTVIKSPNLLALRLGCSKLSLKNVYMRKFAFLPTHYSFGNWTETKGSEFGEIRKHAQHFNVNLLGSMKSFFLISNEIAEDGRCWRWWQKEKFIFNDKPWELINCRSFMIFFDRKIGKFGKLNPLSRWGWQNKTQSSVAIVRTITNASIRH